MILALVMVVTLIPSIGVSAEEYVYDITDNVNSVEYHNMLVSGKATLISSSNTERVYRVSKENAVYDVNDITDSSGEEFALPVGDDTVLQIKLKASGTSIWLKEVTVSSYKGTSTDEFSLVMPDKIGMWYIESKVEEKDEEGKSTGYYVYTVVHQAPLAITEINESFSGTHVFDTWSYVDLTLPYEVVTIPKNAFKDNNKLRSFSVKQRIDTVGSSAFMGCVNLTSVDLSTWVTHNSALNSIPDNCFNGCSSLRDIAIPSEIISIGASAFNNCTKLDSVVLQNSISNIGKNAFSNCYSLRYLYIGNTRKDWITENSKSSIVDEDKLICGDSAKSTKPIVSKDDSGVSCSAKIYSSGLYTVASRVDIKSCSVEKDGVVIDLNNYTSQVYGYDTRAYSFNIDSFGEYKVTAEDVAGNSVVQTILFEKEVVDKTAPIISITSSRDTVNDNYFNNARVVVSDADTEVVDIHINGVSVSNNYNVSSDGTYKIEAWDGVGNKSERTIIVDSVNPTITGISDGDILNKNCTLKFSDDFSGIYKIILNGVEQKNLSTMLLSASGTYCVEVIDMCGNSCSVSFIIDSVGPSSDIVSGAYYKSIIPNITSLCGIVSAVAKNNTTGKQYNVVSGITKLTENGSYTLSLTDALGKTVKTNFVVDSTAPKITGVVNNKYYNTKEVKVTVEDDNLDYTEFDSERKSKSFTFKTDGKHTIKAVDKAGNITSLTFYIDTVMPKLSVKDGYAKTKAFTFKVSDSFSGIKKVYINNKLQKKASSYKLSKQGKYTVKVVDNAGNVKVTKLYVDKTKPTVTGVKNGKTYTKKVTVFGKDTISGIKKVVLDGKVITKAKSVSKVGSHKITVYDNAGNKTTVKFKIAKK